MLNIHGNAIKKVIGKKKKLAVHINYTICLVMIRQRNRDHSEATIENQCDHIEISIHSVNFIGYSR